MVHCSVWSNAMCASQKNCKTTFPKCSLCSRTRASLEMTSGPFMRQYAEEHDILSKPRVMLVGSFRGVKILLATPLLRWYLAHGLVVDRVYQIIEYESNPCFRRFGESVSTSSTRWRWRPWQSHRCRHDEATRQFGLWEDGHQRWSTSWCQVLHRDRYISAHQQQTVSTTGCRHRRRVRNRDEQECREVHTTTSHRLLRLPVRQTTHATVLLRLCRQIRRTTAVSVLRDGHRLGIHCSGWWKHRWTRQSRSSRTLLPTQITVASGRMLWRTRRRLCLCSNSRSPMDGHRVVLFRTQDFRQANAGSIQGRMVRRWIRRLCSKTYYCFGATDKYSTKGLSKRHNDIDKDTFLAVLKNRRSGGGFNRGFRVRDSSVMTYIQERAALTYFYGKRKVLADGLSTAPLEV